MVLIFIGVGVVAAVSVGHGQVKDYRTPLARLSGAAGLGDIVVFGAIALLESLGVMHW